MSTTVPNGDDDDPLVELPEPLPERVIDVVPLDRDDARLVGFPG